jgi:hypothetical protein
MKKSFKSPAQTQRESVISKKDNKDLTGKSRISVFDRMLSDQKIWQDKKDKAK